MLTNRLLKLALLAAFWFAVLKLGPGVATLVWAAVMAAVCCTVAVLMHRQRPPERVTVVNRMAGVVLPWGYKVGRGKLVPVVAISWFIWLLIGGAMALGFKYGPPGWLGRPATSGTPAGPRSSAVMVMIVISWVIDGGLLLHTIGVVLKSGAPGRFARSLGGVMAALIAMIVGSALLVTTSDSAWSARLALGIAGGPIVVFGGGYLLFVVVMLTVGRKARWN